MADSDFDAVVVGAGAAGLFCAARAGQRGLRVLLV
ncbi:MAG TPA: NAD(P)/FAD-dependent oxidoreductase, partial [Caldimonas sp.]|nr:NAD(P)/FAD-dependent oxidoreductase [Caldimonas sp.]